MSSLGIAAGLPSAPDLRAGLPGQAMPSGRDDAFGAVLDMVASTDDPPDGSAEPVPAPSGDAAMPATIGITIHGLATRASGADNDGGGGSAASRTAIDVTAWAAALADGTTDATTDQATKGGGRTGPAAAKLPKTPDEVAVAANATPSPGASVPATPAPDPTLTPPGSDDPGRDDVRARTDPTALRPAKAEPGAAGALAAVASPWPAMPPSGAAAASATVAVSTTAAVVTQAAPSVSGRTSPAVTGTSASAGVQASIPAVPPATASMPSVMPARTQTSPQSPAGSTPVASQDAGKAGADGVRPMEAVTVAKPPNHQSGAVPQAATATTPPSSPPAEAPAPANGSRLEAASTPAQPDEIDGRSSKQASATQPVAKPPDTGDAASRPGGDTGPPPTPGPDQATAALAAGQGQTPPPAAAAAAASLQATPAISVPARPVAAGTNAVGRAGGAGTASAVSVPAKPAAGGMNAADRSGGAGTASATSAIPVPARPVAAGTNAAGRSGEFGTASAPSPARSSPAAASTAAGVFSVAKSAAPSAAPAVAPAVVTQPDAPAATLSAVGQVVTVLQDLGRPADVSGLPAGATATANPDATPGGAPPGRGLTNREVTIQLNPENLGTVQVKMRMRADTIDIRIEVANPQTLHLLDKDRHLLSAAVEALGAGPKALALSGPEPATTAAVRADPQNPFASASSSGGDGRSASQRATPATRSHITRDTSDVPSDTRPDRADSSLYL